MSSERSKQRLEIRIHGAVQGVGFRPFVWRLASELELNGYVNNSSNGVLIEVEGDRQQLDQFRSRIIEEKPAIAFIQNFESSFLEPVNYNDFSIKHSTNGKKTALILPDIATCPDCLKEIFDPKDRRYLYPFNNCTNCGPRFSIIEELPYDRPNTTMNYFPMCPDCLAEYENHENRRFHAQPVACSVCGPNVELWDREGNVLSKKQDSIIQSAEAVKSGKILAVKGLGGFHLIVNACDEKAVNLLRQRKSREEKPFALMIQSMEMISKYCHIDDVEKRLLESPSAPIILLEKFSDQINEDQLANSVAPDNPYLGAMLPYTPLHHILLNEIGFPIVATSGNLAEEPICTDENDALKTLGNLADLFLVHNRPIARPVDDSIVRVMADRELVIRRGRGYAPLPVQVKNESDGLLAVGAHLKNTVALSVGSDVFVSQHIGNLETKKANDAFKESINNLAGLYDKPISTIVCDKHPDYASSQYAKDNGSKIVMIQHHYAHILSCMAENRIEPPLLGISWDGTGLGDDGTIWGGEFFKLGENLDYFRFATLKQFQLPGGDVAAKEPRRVGLSLLYNLLGDDVFDRDDLSPIKSFKNDELKILSKMLRNSVNSPLTSSIGRLFDGVSSILGLQQINSYEGQAAMKLEFAAKTANSDESYPVTILESEITNSPLGIDWSDMLLNILHDLKLDISTEVVAAKFHNWLSDVIVKITEMSELEKVVMSGGCFQNRYLLEGSVKKLQKHGYKTYWHQRIPPNDGGISLGQIVAAGRD